MTKPHIAFFLPSLRGGGAERTMLNIATGLSESGYTVDLILAQAVGEYLDQVPEHIRLVNLKSNSAIASTPGLVRYLRREKPCVIFPVLPHISLVALVGRVLAGSRTRVIPVQQNTLSQSIHHANSFKERILPVFMRKIYPLANRIIAVSEGVADDLSTVLRIPRQHINVIYNPVVTSDLLAQSKETSGHHWLKPGQPPVVLGVGRLTRAKGFSVLIRAFSEVQKTTPSRLIILGDGPDRHALEGLIKELNLTDRVSLPGFAPNPYVFFRNSAVFVLSSLWEGLPTVLIEALACGTPVISTDCPSGPREILDDGRWGTLVPIGDGKLLAQSIKETLTRPDQVPSEMSWARFTLKLSISKYRTLLGELETGL
jgi:glycosyltransferase involved in cell wall biosynthesis